MAVGAVTKYNQLESVIFGTSGRQWDDTTTGSMMFCLVTNGYTPSAAHTTTTDLSTNVITTGDGSPIVLASPTLNNTTTAGRTYYDSADASFGSAVTITAKYLVCVQPVTANTFSATTSKLLFYVDLDTTSSSTSFSSTGSNFTVYAPANGWFYTE